MQINNQKSKVKSQKSKLKIYQIKPHLHYPDIQGAVITIGGFDGVHRGHQKIFKQGIALANKIKKPFGVITFSPIPAIEIYKYFHFALTTDKEKIEVLQNLKVDFLGMIKFTSHIKNIEAGQFISDYIVKTIKPSIIVVGEDFHFGKEHKGNIALLKKLGQEFGFDVKVVLSYKSHNALVKSTRIRELIILGNVRRANELLDRPHSITGKIIKGKGLATQLGFPTLNIKIPEKEKLVPADGVYQIKAKFSGKTYDGVMNIGFTPTIPDKLRAYSMRSLEIHLLDYVGTSETSLGKELRVEFYNYLRPEKKFDSLEELKHQIAEDIKKVKGMVK